MSSQGPNFPTVATGNTNTIGAGTQTWGTPANCEAADGVFTATTINTGGPNTDDLIGTGFGFSVPGSAVIKGITLEVNAKDGLNTAVVLEKNIRLLKAGVAAGTDKATGLTLSGVAGTFVYGGATDLWGTTWAPSDVNASNFGACVVYTNAGSGVSSTPSVDFMRITVSFTVSASGFMVFFP